MPRPPLLQGECGGSQSIYGEWLKQSHKTSCVQTNRESPQALSLPHTRCKTQQKHISHEQLYNASQHAARYQADSG